MHAFSTLRVTFRHHLGSSAQRAAKFPPPPRRPLPPLDLARGCDRRTDPNRLQEVMAIGRGAGNREPGPDRSFLQTAL